MGLTEVDVAAYGGKDRVIFYSADGRPNLVLGTDYSTQGIAHTLAELREQGVKVNLVGSDEDIRRVRDRFLAPPPHLPSSAWTRSQQAHYNESQRIVPLTPEEIAGLSAIKH